MTLQDGLIGHWPLASDGLDHGPHGLQTTAHDVAFADTDGKPAGVFDGKASRLTVDAAAQLGVGKGDFTVAAWIHTDAVRDDIVGDVISRYDPDARRGFGLSVVTNAGVTITAQANRRHVHFGIDDGHIENEWTDHGRVGEASKVASLATIEGRLYAGTFEHGEDLVGGLYVFEGSETWTLLGRPPEACNTVCSIARLGGDLYVATGRYNPNGSCMGDALNTNPGGKVYRVKADGSWEFAGHPGSEDAVPEHVVTESAYRSGKADDAFALTVFNGEMFVVSNHRNNVFKYEGGTSWKNIGLDSRLFTFSIYQGRLYALANGGPVYRYDGDDNWTYCGKPETSSQTYAGMIVDGQFYVGTWPQCEVYRYDGGETWTLISRVGYEREVMAMASYNQKGYVGTLPMANVWRMDGKWFSFVGNLDNTREAYLRRVWSMAVYDGRLYGGTLPAGRVLSLQAGALASTDRELAGGWRHIAGVKQGGKLSIYIDGELAATSAVFDADRFNVDADAPLHIGFGGHTHFSGSMRDVRVYSRAIDASELAAVSRI